MPPQDNRKLLLPDDNQQLIAGTSLFQSSHYLKSDKYNMLAII